MRKLSKNVVCEENSYLCDFSFILILRSKAQVKMKHNFIAITKVYLSPLHRGLGLLDTLPVNLHKEKDYEIQI